MKSQEIRMNAWDRMMAAVTFAEAGEPGSAIVIMECEGREESRRPRTPIRAWDRLMAAITFAEAGERETAMEIMGQRSRKESHPSRITDQKRSEKRQDLRM